MSRQDILNEKLLSADTSLHDENDDDGTKVHASMLKETKTLMLHAVIVGGLAVITYGLRFNVVVLYAKSFLDNYSLISTITYISCLFGGAVCLVVGSIADKYRFDVLIILALLWNTIFWYGEAVSFNFAFFAITYILGGVDETSLCVGYVTRMLPVSESKHYVSTLYQIYSISVVFAPVIGGIIAHFWGYRAVFYTSATIAVILLIYSLIFVGNKQKHLEEKQIRKLSRFYSMNTIVTNVLTNENDTINTIDTNDTNDENGGLRIREAGNNTDDDNDDRDDRDNETGEDNDNNYDHGHKWRTSVDHRFPVCLVSIDSKLKTPTENKDKETTSTSVNHRAGNEDSTGPRTDNLKKIGGIESKASLAKNESGLNEFGSIKYQWFLTVMFSIEYALTMGNEAIFARWYSAYIIDNFDGNIIISTAQYATLGLFVFAGMGVIKRIVKKEKDGNVNNTSNNNNSNNKYSSLTALENNKNNGNNNTNIKSYTLSNQKMLIPMICSIILAILTCFVCPTNGLVRGYNWIDSKVNGSENNDHIDSKHEYIWAYFIYLAVIGFGIGLCNMSFQMIVIEVQFKGLSGRVSGIKHLLNQMARGFGGFIVGVLWTLDIEYFWYIQAINMGLVFVLTVIVVCFESCRFR